MADNQTLAAVQEILLKSRIQFITGTEAEWTAANPVLLDGEYGLVRGTSPLKYKVGDGTKTWSALGWANVTSLAQLMADASHRLVTDAQITGWNEKADVFTFNYNAYLHPPTEGLNPQGQVAKNIVAAVNANKKCVIMAHRVTVPEMQDYLSGMVSITEVSASAVTGLINDIRVASDKAGTIFLATAEITFKSDGTVTVGTAPYTPRIIQEEGLPEYSTEKAPTVSGFAATYYLTKDGQRLGVPINIPLDQVLRGSSIKTVTTANTPYSGAKVGDKYIEFLFQNNNTPQYLPVQDLVDIYKGDNTYIEVSSTNVITLKYSALKTQLQNDFGSVFDPKGAGAAAAKAAIDEFKKSTFIIKCTIPGMN